MGCDTHHRPYRRAVLASPGGGTFRRTLGDIKCSSYRQAVKPSPGGELLDLGQISTLFNTTRNALITEGFLSKAFGPSRRPCKMVITEGFCSSILGSKFSKGFGLLVVWWSKEDARLSGAFRSSSLGVKSSIKGFWLTADLLPFAPLSRRLSSRESVDNPCGGHFVLCFFPCRQVIERVEGSHQRVKVGCKKVELKYPTVHHFQVGKVHHLVFAMFIVFC
ncbi:hypothetical protein V8G54_034145 [Vigna mungo]|uniref:Uncharacterized protein n=1 Tax=Vigna mungo TaxID=3915 RepID=A0AAQ3MPP3_VIGMU